MKILIAYDGSSCSDAALDDLVRAGLPDNGEALVLSVAEVWLPPPNESNSLEENPAGFHFDAETQERIEGLWDRGKTMLAEAEVMAGHAKKRIERFLPGWKVDGAASYGSPAWEILAKADEFAADLIIVGSQGRSAIGRFMLGSISQKVLTEAHCSVRVARGRIEVDETPVRILIAFDGSKGSFAALNSVASRCWPAGSEIRIVSAAEQLAPSAIGRFIPPVARMVEEVNVSERSWLERQAESAMAAFASTGIPVSFNIIAGSPKQVLIEEAARWNADCIFLGANKFGSRTERFLLGSTSAAIAARASSSVEVVRTTEQTSPVAQ
jgi:nucleotide-binding universal stress UspA family protein